MMSFYLILGMVLVVWKLLVQFSCSAVYTQAGCDLNTLTLDNWTGSQIAVYYYSVLDYILYS